METLWAEDVEGRNPNPKKDLIPDKLLDIDTVIHTRGEERKMLLILYVPMDLRWSRIYYTAAAPPPAKGQSLLFKAGKSYNTATLELKAKEAFAIDL